MKIVIIIVMRMVIRIKMVMLIKHADENGVLIRMVIKMVIMKMMRW